MEIAARRIKYCQGDFITFKDTNKYVILFVLAVTVNIDLIYLEVNYFYSIFIMFKSNAS